MSVPAVVRQGAVNPSVCGAPGYFVHTFFVLVHAAHLKHTERVPQRVKSGEKGENGFKTEDTGKSWNRPARQWTAIEFVILLWHSDTLKRFGYGMPIHTKIQYTHLDIGRIVGVVFRAQPGSRRAARNAPQVHQIVTAATEVSKQKRTHKHFNTVLTAIKNRNREVFQKDSTYCQLNSQIQQSKQTSVNKGRHTKQLHTWLPAGHGEGWTWHSTPSDCGQRGSSQGARGCASPRTSLCGRCLRWSTPRACLDCSPHSCGGWILAYRKEHIVAITNQHRDKWMRGWWFESKKIN